MRSRKELLDFLRFSPDILTSYSEEYGLYTFKYKHSGIDFSIPEHSFARGLTLTEAGRPVLVGYRKFFNYLELEGRSDYSAEFIEDFCSFSWREGERCAFREKLDGSLILLGEYKGNLIAATSSGFMSEQSKKAFTFFNNHPKRDELIARLHMLNSTMLFEYISPTNQIVIPYEEEDYVLLDIVHNETFSRDLPFLVDQEADLFGFSRPKILYFNREEILFQMQNNVSIEGFVGVNQKGNLIKFKTKEWFKLSKDFDLFNANTIRKDFVNLVVPRYYDNTIDDLVAYCQQNRKSKANDYIKTIISHLEAIELEIAEAADRFAKGIQVSNDARKEFAANRDYCNFVKSCIWKLPNYREGNFHDRIGVEILRRIKG